MQKKVLPFSLKASAWLIAGAGSLFPGLAARIFFRLYGTPPKRKLRELHLATRAKAKCDVARFSKYAFDPSGLSVGTYVWGDGKGKKVLVMHGWSDTALGFPSLTDELVRVGYTVTAFDAPAHGSSEGRRTNLVQWIHVLDQFLQKEGPVYAVIGHSVGALVAVLTLARKGHAVPKLILAGAPLSAPAFFQDTFELFGIRPKVIAKVYRLVQTRLKDDLRTMDLDGSIDRMPATKVLMVYDGRDQLVRQEDVAGLLERHPEVIPFRFEGGGHFRILRDTAVIGRIVSFLTEG